MLALLVCGLGFATVDAAATGKITVVTKPGPGTDEAGGTDAADYITSTCRIVRLRYEFGSQGAINMLPWFTVRNGTITSAANPGKPWTGSTLRLVKPAANQVVYLRDDKEALHDAQCAP